MITRMPFLAIATVVGLAAVTGSTTPSAAATDWSWLGNRSYVDCLKTHDRLDCNRIYYPTACAKPGNCRPARTPGKLDFSWASNKPYVECLKVYPTSTCNKKYYPEYVR